MFNVMCVIDKSSCLYAGTISDITSPCGEGGDLYKIIINHGPNHGQKVEGVQHVANHLSSPYHKIHDVPSRDPRKHNL